MGALPAAVHRDAGSSGYGRVESIQFLRRIPDGWETQMSFENAGLAFGQMA